MYLLTALATLFAGLTLAIVVWQEYRRWRERPQARIAVEKVGHLTRGPNDERWELIEVVNSGDAPITNLRAAWTGVKLLADGRPGEHIAYKLPLTMAVGQVVQLGVRGDDLGRAYVQIVGKRLGSKWTMVQWFPVLIDGDADDVWTEQLKRSSEASALRRRPHRWRPSRRPVFRDTARPVGPYVDGVPSARIKDGAPDFGARLDIALGKDARVLDGLTNSW